VLQPVLQCLSGAGSTFTLNAPIGSGRGARQNWDARRRQTPKSSCAGAKPRPRLRPGWALVRVRLAGICNTDIEILRGYHNFVGTLGHEFVGDVVGVADARDKDWIGRRVVGEINLTCAGWGFAILARGSCAGIAAGEFQCTAGAAASWEFWAMTAPSRNSWRCRS